MNTSVTLSRRLIPVEEVHRMGEACMLTGDDRVELISDGHQGGLPGPADVLLRMEVSDTTPACDRDAKLPVYARHGIPEVWIVDVNARTLTAFLDPSVAGYRCGSVAAAGATLPLSQLPGVSIPLDDLFGAG